MGFIVPESSRCLPPKPENGTQRQRIFGRRASSSVNLVRERYRNRSSILSSRLATPKCRSASTRYGGQQRALKFRLRSSGGVVTDFRGNEVSFGASSTASPWRILAAARA